MQEENGAVVLSAAGQENGVLAKDECRALAAALREEHDARTQETRELRRLCDALASRIEGQAGLGFAKDSDGPVLYQDQQMQEQLAPHFKAMDEALRSEVDSKIMEMEFQIRGDIMSRLQAIEAHIAPPGGAPLLARVSGIEQQVQRNLTTTRATFQGLSSRVDVLESKSALALRAIETLLQVSLPTSTALPDHASTRSLSSFVGASTHDQLLKSAPGFISEAFSQDRSPGALGAMGDRLHNTAPGSLSKIGESEAFGSRPKFNINAPALAESIPEETVNGFCSPVGGGGYETSGDGFTGPSLSMDGRTAAERAKEHADARSGLALVSKGLRDSLASFVTKVHSALETKPDQVRLPQHGLGSEQDDKPPLGSPQGTSGTWSSLQAGGYAAEELQMPTSQSSILSRDTAATVENMMERSHHNEGKSSYAQAQADGAAAARTAHEAFKNALQELLEENRALQRESHHLSGVSESPAVGSRAGSMQLSVAAPTAATSGSGLSPVQVKTIEGMANEASPSSRLGQGAQFLSPRLPRPELVSAVPVQAVAEREAQHVFEEDRPPLGQSIPVECATRPALTEGGEMVSEAILPMPVAGIDSAANPSTVMGQPRPEGVSSQKGAQAPGGPVAPSGPVAPGGPVYTHGSSFPGAMPAAGSFQNPAASLPGSVQFAAQALLPFGKELDHSQRSVMTAPTVVMPVMTSPKAAQSSAASPISSMPASTSHTRTQSPQGRPMFPSGTRSRGGSIQVPVGASPQAPVASMAGSGRFGVQGGGSLQLPPRGTVGVPAVVGVGSLQLPPGGGAASHNSPTNQGGAVGGQASGPWRFAADGPARAASPGASVEVLPYSGTAGFPSRPALPVPLQPQGAATSPQFRAQNLSPHGHRAQQPGPWPQTARGA